MNRVAVFDNIKFFLIVLVIYGHLTNIGCLVPWPIYRIIYSFHMPLFVFISGYFTKKQDPKFFRSILNLFFLYVVFSLISYSVNIVFYQKPAFSSFFKTPFALWYLLCLIYWKTIIRFIPSLVLKSLWFLGIVLLVSVFPLFFMLDFFSLSRCLSFFPFFLVGWLAREGKWFERFVSETSRNKRKSILTFVLLSLICSILAITIPTDVYWGLKPVDAPFHLVLVFRVLSWGIAVVLSLTIFLLMPNKEGFEEGRHTLFYYLYHTILLFPLFDYVIDFLPNTILTSFATLFCIILILFLMRRIGFLNKLLVIGKQ